MAAESRTLSSNARTLARSAGGRVGTLCPSGWLMTSGSWNSPISAMEPLHGGVRRHQIDVGAANHECLPIAGQFCKRTF